MGRRLDPQEKALWGRVVATVKPLSGAQPLPTTSVRLESVRRAAQPPTVATNSQQPPKMAQVPGHNLDSHWDRRFAKGAVVPDISIDLHGQGLATAHARLDRTLEQAIHQRLRVILLVTGKLRGHDRASGTGRGAIAAVVRDWLAASRHCAAISAVRTAHPRHGGEGALYIILKR